MLSSSSWLAVGNVLVISAAHCAAFLPAPATPSTRGLRPAVPGISNLRRPARLSAPSMSYLDDLSCGRQSVRIAAAKPGCATFAEEASRMGGLEHGGCLSAERAEVVNQQPCYPASAEVAGFGDNAIRIEAPTLFRNSIQPDPAQCPAPWDDAEGNYIIRTGDLLGGRYEVIERVGTGTFGIVVKCRDRQELRDVAVKIIKSPEEYREAAIAEIQVLNDLARRDPEDASGCIKLLDSFEHKGHFCLSFPLAGLDLSTFLKQNSERSFSTFEVQSIAGQLLEAVAFMHRWKLTHTDLKTENILFVDSDWDYHVHSKYSVSRVVKDKRIVVIDLGCATYEHEFHAPWVSTGRYRAPELVLELGWSYPMDMWGVGCILLELFNGVPAFEAENSLDHLAMMERVLGKLPMEMTHAHQFGSVALHYTPEGHLMWPTKESDVARVQNAHPLQQHFDFGREDHRQLFDLIKGLLAYDPHSRITAEQALCHPFFAMEISSDFDHSTLLDEPR